MSYVVKYGGGGGGGGEALISEITQGKEDIAAAINAKGGTADPLESFQQLAQDIEDMSQTLINQGLETTEPINFLKFICSADIPSYRLPLRTVNNDDITTISLSYVFANCTGLQSVTMNALTTISGGNCFSGCTGLQSVTMNALTTISGGNCFYGCSSLSEINMDNLSVVSGQSVFANCNALQNIALPSLLTISGYSIFIGCPALQSVSFISLTSITNSYTFASCISLHYVYMPLLSNFAGGGTFQNCPLYDLTVGTLTAMNEQLSTNKVDLRNIKIGADTNVNLPFQMWTATNVIAEGQSGIDELNSNLYNNLLTKLYDHSNDGQTRTLRLGWLSRVTAENIAYANAKGWTLTT